MFLKEYLAFLQYFKFWIGELVVSVPWTGYKRKGDIFSWKNFVELQIWNSWKHITNMLFVGKLVLVCLIVFIFFGLSNSNKMIIKRFSLILCPDFKNTPLFKCMVGDHRECVRAGAAGSRTRRSSGDHLLNPQNFDWTRRIFCLILLLF